MPMELAIILNNKIRYCSSESAFPKFEIAIFANILINQIAENRNWTIHKLIMRPIGNDKPLKLLLRKQISPDQTEIIICLLGELKMGTDYSYRILDSFFQQILNEYPLSDITKSIEENEEEFLSLANLLTSTIFGQHYEQIINDSSQEEACFGESQLIYAGISTNGLPIIAKLYENQTILQIENQEKENLITTILSGQLATISINSLIRAHCYMDSVQIKIDPDEQKFIFFNFTQFGANNSFTLETLCAGNPQDIFVCQKSLYEYLAGDKLFFEQFSGELKKFNPVRTYLYNIQNNLCEK